MISEHRQGARPLHKRMNIFIHAFQACITSTTLNPRCSQKAVRMRTQFLWPKTSVQARSSPRLRWGRRRSPVSCRAASHGTAGPSAAPQRLLKQAAPAGLLGEEERLRASPKPCVRVWIQGQGKGQAAGRRRAALRARRRRTLRLPRRPRGARACRARTARRVRARTVRGAKLLALYGLREAEARGMQRPALMQAGAPGSRQTQWRSRGGLRVAGAHAEPARLGRPNYSAR